ncbi:RimK family alpha-L-glutamate ligase [Streptomyces sp. MP131-18]|uniref:RimK family alpha-L-glutamate ligase n=1 Tax=Streptomyces sp. MP131-18 TaxID=1857892 RepID=UPI00097C3C10|nr:RimK family alpha-L-glutamate ligase [Streptomyces sp. MP131-18]ONK10465.1 Alpha-aminoadipate--LysW ligase LysX [Streptomyces sp. MP131-18]
MSTPVAEKAVAVLASRVGVEEKRILSELRRRGVPSEQVDVRRLWTDARTPAGRWRLAINREIGFHRSVHTARSLHAQGVRVCNSAEATEVCGDKWRSALAFERAGLRTPRTVLALSPDAVLDALAAVGYPAVIKPLVGSWGRMVAFVPDRRTGRTLLEYIAALPHPQSRIVCVQEYLGGGRELRVLVAGGEPVAAMWRRGADWRGNVALGGRGTYCEPSAEVAATAVAAAACVGAGMAGVDLIETDDGSLQVLEVNHRVEFAGLQAAAADRVDIAARLVDHVLRQVR